MVVGQRCIHIAKLNNKKEFDGKKMGNKTEVLKGTFNNSSIFFLKKSLNYKHEKRLHLQFQWISMLRWGAVHVFKYKRCILSVVIITFYNATSYIGIVFCNCLQTKYTLAIVSPYK